MEGDSMNVIDVEARERDLPIREWDSKRKSEMWDHFRPNFNNLGKIVSKNCIYCDVRLTHNKNNGTSSMKKHLGSCSKCPVNIDKKQKKMSDYVESAYNPAQGEHEFDAEAIRLALAKMVIIDEEPFSMVEREGFRLFCSTACPKFNVPSRFTVARDCKKLFVCQKDLLKNKLRGLNSRIALTTDCWTSIQNLGYLCLTAHFIDDEWNLHKRILNFKVIDSHKGKEVGKVVEKCVLDWGIEDKLCSITVDNASANDVAVGYLKDNLSGKFVLDGEYFQVRCSAHVLNLVVRDGLSLVKDSILKIRTAVRYVRSSPSRARSFDACVAREKIQYKNTVCLDVATRWNSTYLMLDVALKFQRAFTRLGKEDKQFANDLMDVGGIPGADDWEKARVLTQFLRHFYESTKRMSGTLYSTSNMHFHELFLILSTLSDWELDPNDGLNDMAAKMKTKFELYYGDFKKKTNLMVLVAVVLDPRYKLRFIKFAMKKLYPYDTQKVDETYNDLSVVVRRLFDFYATNSVHNGGVGNVHGSTSSTSVDDDMLVTSDMLASKNKHYNEWQMEEDDVDHGDISELDKYLAAPRSKVEGPFDILHWWKERDQDNTYPILSSMAKDILAIPVSTVSSESAFSTSGRVLDQFRSTLGPKTVESLICGQDWLRASKISIELEQLLEDVHQYEQELTNVDGEFEDDFED